MQKKQLKYFLIFIGWWLILTVTVFCTKAGGKKIHKHMSSHISNLGGLCYTSENYIKITESYVKLCGFQPVNGAGRGRGTPPSLPRPRKF